jgi:hypothetical protein
MQRTKPVKRTARPKDVAVLEGAFEDWNANRIDDVAARYSPDAELDLSAVMPEARAIRDLPRLRHFWRMLRENWYGVRLDVVDIIDVTGDGRYVVDCRLRSTRSSNGDTLKRMVYVFTLDDEQVITRCQAAPDLETAIRLAGEG